MKTVVRRSKDRDGNTILSMAIQASQDELDGAIASSDMPQNISVSQLLEFARDGEMDMFFCFLRILVSDIRLWNDRGTELGKRLIKENRQRAAISAFRMKRR